MDIPVKNKHDNQINDLLLSLLVEEGSDIVILLKANEIIEFNTNAELYFQCKKNTILHKSYTYLSSQSPHGDFISQLLTRESLNLIDTFGIKWIQQTSGCYHIIIGKDIEHYLKALSYAKTQSDIKNELAKALLEKEQIATEYKTISQYLQDIISAVPGSIYWKNLDGIYLGCNDFMAKTAGLAITDIIGKSDYDLWPNQAPKLRENDQRVMELGQSIQIEEEVTLPNGKKRFFIVAKMPLHDSNGKLNGIIGNSMEITDLKTTQEALELANKAKTEFIGNMSHDIRTPLTGVVGMSKLLEENVRDENLKQYAKWLGESGTQLLHMLNEILDTVSAEQVNENDLHEEPFNLKHIIYEIVQLERPSTVLKGIKLLAHVDENIPKILISDYTKIHRILLNLLGNAVKFTQSGSIDIFVKVVSRSKTDVVLQFQITDTGIGIPYELQDKVFDRFFRVTPSYKGIYKGHGLGLHIAQSYAHLLGGNISLTSEPGVGTSFYFDLSLKIGNEVTAKQTPSSSTLTLPLSEKRKPKTANIPHILLVEDNHIALFTLEKLVTQAGCRYTSAKDGEAALELAKKQTFDLIITDIGLPKLSGIDFTLMLRAFEKEHDKKAVPIIGLTAHAGEKIKNECLLSGMNEAFTKPMNEKILCTLNTLYCTNELPQQTTLNKIQTEGEKKNLIDNISLLNTQNAFVSMGNDISLLRTILTAMVQQQIPKAIEELDNAYSVKDWDAIEKLAHSIKAGGIYCGVEKLTHACQNIERYYKTGRSSLREPLYQQLRIVMEETVVTINKWLTAQT